ncbi:MAG: hypothetical protein ACNA7H_11430 [Desulfotignum sp.]
MNRKPTYEELTARVRELEARVRELAHADGFRTQTSDPDIIRTLSESFQQLADRSQDAIYLLISNPGPSLFSTSGSCPSSGAGKRDGPYCPPPVSPSTSTLRKIELSSKIQRISKYATKDYVQGKKIVDIDAAANKK